MEESSSCCSIDSILRSSELIYPLLTDGFWKLGFCQLLLIDLGVALWPYRTSSSKVLVLILEVSISPWRVLPSISISQLSIVDRSCHSVILGLGKLVLRTCSSEPILIISRTSILRRFLRLWPTKDVPYPA